MIVVTGGAGFIGSNLLAGLEARGEDPVVVCDMLGSGDKWRNIAKREIADIVPPAGLLDWLDSNASDVHLVFHLGALSSTTERDVDAIVANNFRLTSELWSWCAQRGTRFIYASSAAVYGDGSSGFDDDPDPAAMAVLQPLNPYGWSKLAFDRRAARLSPHRGHAPAQWAGLRFFNVYGPNEYHKGGQRSVVPQFWEQIREQGRARLFRSHHENYADGGQLRDFVHIDDCVDVLLWLYENPSTNGLFNLGTGEARSFEDLARAVFDALEKPIDIEFIDMPDHIRSQYQYFTQARMDRLREAGYDRAFTPLEEGVCAYVRTYLEAQDRYR